MRAITTADVHDALSLVVEASASDHDAPFSEAALEQFGRLIRIDCQIANAEFDIAHRDHAACRATLHGARAGYAEVMEHVCHPTRCAKPMSWAPMSR